MKLDDKGYITRRTTRGSPFNRTYRNWFLVKNNNNDGTAGHIPLTGLYLPKKYIGKRVRFKIEIVNEEDEEK